MAGACQRLWLVGTDGGCGNSLVLGMSSSRFPEPRWRSQLEAFLAEGSFPKGTGMMSRQLPTRPLPVAPVPIGYCGRNRRSSYVFLILNNHWIHLQVARKDFPRTGAMNSPAPHSSGEASPQRPSQCRLCRSSNALARLRKAASLSPLSAVSRRLTPIAPTGRYSVAPLLRGRRLASPLRLRSHQKIALDEATRIRGISTPRASGATRARQRDCAW